MLSLITAALQGLAAIPKLIDSFERLVQFLKDERVKQLQAEIDEVFAKLERPTTDEEKFQLAEKLQDIIRR